MYRGVSLQDFISRAASPATAHLRSRWFGGDVIDLGQAANKAVDLWALGLIMSDRLTQPARPVGLHHLQPQIKPSLSVGAATTAVMPHPSMIGLRLKNPFQFIVSIELTPTASTRERPRPPRRVHCGAAAAARVGGADAPRRRRHQREKDPAPLEGCTAAQQQPREYAQRFEHDV